MNIPGRNAQQHTSTCGGTINYTTPPTPARDTNTRQRTVDVPRDDHGGLVLVEERLHGAHRRLRLALALVSEVGVVPRAVHHHHQPRREGAVC